MLSVEFLAPVDVGRNTTLTVHVAPTASAVLQLLV